MTLAPDGEPKAVVAEDETPAEEREGSWHVIIAVLKNKMVLLLAIVYFLVKTPRYLFLLWAPVYVNARLGLGLFGIGFLLNIPDSPISGTAAVDFGTKKGAATAAGFINGSGSIGAIVGGTLPGWIEHFVPKDQSIWPYIFPSMGIALALAAALLLPKWNELPPTAT